MLGGSGDEATVAQKPRFRGEKGSFLRNVPYGGDERDASLASGCELRFARFARFAGSHPVRTITFDSTPPATAFVGGFFVFRTRIRVNPLHVEYRQVETLIPYARNPRTHSDAQIAKIAASIAEFGWTSPILVDAVQGVIAGHGRLAAAVAWSAAITRPQLLPWRGRDRAAATDRQAR